MNQMTCMHTWKAEAIRDGRVVGAETTVFMEHATECRTCLGAVRHLDRIADELAQIPVPQPTLLGMRLQRQRLLKEATLAASSGGAGWRITPRVIGWVSLDAAAALAICWMGYRHLGANTAALPPLASEQVAEVSAREIPPSLEVVVKSGTQWSRQSEPTVERVVLHEGELWVKMTREPSRQRVSFRVPDGELEDHGTVAVIVKDGRTRRVSVEAGSVDVRLRDHAEFRLTAGQSWEAEAAASEVQPTALVNAEEAALVVATADQDEAPLPSAKPSRRKRDAASAALAAGTAALRGGRYDAAAAAFGKFLAGRGSDPRAEDASYLRALSLVRAGRPEEARSAAQTYLSKFPAGFRRTEMEGFVTGTSRATRP